MYAIRFTTTARKRLKKLPKEIQNGIIERLTEIMKDPFDEVKMLRTSNKTPIYSFPYADGKNKVPYTKAFRDDVGFNSRYQIQFGIRYIFN